MSELAAQLSSLSLIGLMLTGFVVAFGDSALGLGLLLPGEATIVVLAAANDSLEPRLVLWVGVALGALAGDQIGFFVGQRLGPRLERSSMVAKLPANAWARTANLVQNGGMAPLFLSRLTPVVRTLMPGVAGATGVNHHRFTFASILGSLAWALVWVSAGSFSAAAVSSFGLPVLLGAALVVLGFWWHRRHRSVPLARSTAQENESVTTS